MSKTTDIVGLAALANKDVIRDDININEIENKILGKINSTESHGNIQLEFDKELDLLTNSLGIDFGENKKEIKQDYKFKNFDLRNDVSRNDVSRNNNVSQKTKNDSDDDFGFGKPISYSKPKQKELSEYSGSSSYETESESYYTESEYSGSETSSIRSGRSKRSHKSRRSNRYSDSGSDVSYSQRDRNKSSKLDILLEDGRKNISSNGISSLDTSNSNELISISDMIGEIDNIRYNLSSEGYDMDGLPEINPASKYEDIKRIYNFYKKIYEQQKYKALPEDIILTFTDILEKIFDEDTKIFGKYTVNYNGINSTMKNKLDRVSGHLSRISANIAEKYGMSDATWILLELAIPFISIPIKNSSNIGNAPVKNHYTMRNAQELDSY